MRLQKRRMMVWVLALTIVLALFVPKETAYAANTGLPQDDPIVIVLDPGHGGGDGGATRKWDGKSYREKTMNLAIARACKAKLEEYTGVEVYLTRSSDYYVSLEGRVNFAKKKGADLFVSLHNNASYKSKDRGACVFYPNAGYKSEIGKNGRLAAQCIQKKLVACGLKNNGIRYRNSETRSRYPDKSLADYYSVIKRSKLAGFPGVIVEHAYVSNSSDCRQFLGSAARLKKLGEADAAGIAEYFGLVEMDTPELTEVNANEDGSVTLVWELSEEADGYLLYRKEAGEKNYVQLDELEDGGVSEYTDVSTEPGIKYVYTLCAYHEGKQKYIYTEMAYEVSVTTCLTDAQEPADGQDSAEEQNPSEVQETEEVQQPSEMPGFTDVQEVEDINEM